VTKGGALAILVAQLLDFLRDKTSRPNMKKGRGIYTPSEIKPLEILGADYPALVGADNLAC
jgi:hypothetical protein